MKYKYLTCANVTTYTQILQRLFFNSKQNIEVKYTCFTFIPWFFVKQNLSLAKQSI